MFIMGKTTNYQNGKIYKVVDNSYEMCYIGSTIDTLNNRFTGHKKHYREYLNCKRGHVTVFNIFDRFGYENCKIELIELYPCESKMELHAREGSYQKQMDCVNKFISGRTSKEYHQDNKEIQHHGSKLYYEKSKDKVLERQRN